MEITGRETLNGALKVYQELQREIPYTITIRKGHKTKCLNILAEHLDGISEVKHFEFKEGDYDYNVSQFEEFKSFINDIHNYDHGSYGENYF